MPRITTVILIILDICIHYQMLSFIFNNPKFANKESKALMD